MFWVCGRVPWSAAAVAGSVKKTGRGRGQNGKADCSSHISPSWMRGRRVPSQSHTGARPWTRRLSGCCPEP